MIGRGKGVGALEKTTKQEKKKLDLWGTLYADDIALLAPSRDNLQEMLQEINLVLTDYGMTISAEKTKVMVCPGKAEEKVDALNIKLGDEKIEEVKMFKYVGGIITTTGEVKEEIEQRIKTAGMAFGGLRSRLFGNRKMARNVKLRVYESLVLAILLYGSETWNIKAEEAKKLESFHMGCLRCLAGKSKVERIRNVVIRKELGQTTIQSMMRKRRLRWLGHVRRMDDERWPKQMMYAWIDGVKRPKGKAKQRWRDTVNKDLKELGLRDDWYDRAAQREEWRKIIHTKEQERFENAEKKEKDKVREWPCPKRECTEKCRSEKGLRMHVERKHPLTCWICGKEWKNDRALGTHLRTCSRKKETTEAKQSKGKEKEKKIEKGNDEWVYQIRPKQQQQRESTSSSSSSTSDSSIQERHQCLICKEFLPTAKGLKIHITRKHNNQVASETDPSTATSSSSSTETSPSYTTQPSSSSSSSTSLLATQDLTCPWQCGFTANYPKGLKCHIRITHRNQLPETPNPPSSSPSASISMNPILPSLTKGLSPHLEPTAGANGDAVT